MKILIIFCTLFFSFSINAEKQIKIHGFSIQIPDHYQEFNKNSDLFITFYDQLEKDLQLFNSSMKDAVVMYNEEHLQTFSQYNFVPYLIFVPQKGEYLNFTYSIVENYCSFLKKDFLVLECGISSIPNIYGNSFKFELYSASTNTLVIQYIFYLNHNLQIFANYVCLYEYCEKDRKDFKKIISSIRKDYSLK